MNIKEHYNTLLARVYAWMSGDFKKRTIQFKSFLQQQNIVPLSTKNAVNLGAGHGIQSIALAELGFDVIAVDNNQQLLNELEINANGLSIVTRNDDIQNLAKYSKDAELIVCCGDTLSHLENKEELDNLVLDIYKVLVENGVVILSFRDYSVARTGEERFIPVRSDDSRILTCVLHYEPQHVNVTDLLYEKTNDQWIQKISSYKKIRLIPTVVQNLLLKNNLSIVYTGI